MIRAGNSTAREGIVIYGYTSEAERTMGRNVPLSVARSIVTAAALALFVGFAARPAAAAYPDRPIRLLISFPPGGSSDAMARIVQPGMEKLLGQPIVIEN